MNIQTRLDAYSISCNFSHLLLLSEKIINVGHVRRDMMFSSRFCERSPRQSSFKQIQTCRVWFIAIWLRVTVTIGTRSIKCIDVVALRTLYTVCEWRRSRSKDGNVSDLFPIRSGHRWCRGLTTCPLFDSFEGFHLPELVTSLSVELLYWHTQFPIVALISNRFESPPGNSLETRLPWDLFVPKMTPPPNFGRFGRFGGVVQILPWCSWICKGWRPPPVYLSLSCCR